MKIGTIVVIDNSPVEIGEVMYSSDGASVLGHAAEGRLAIFFPELDEMRLYKNNSPKIKKTYDEWALCFLNEPQLSSKLQQMYLDFQSKRGIAGHVHNGNGGPGYPKGLSVWVNYATDIRSVSGKTTSAKQCICPISDLMARGCKCGYLHKT